MQVSWKTGRRIGIGLAIVVVAAVLIVRAWVIPALIAGQLRSLSGGAVTIGDWWLNGRSSGVVGLVLHRGTATDAPAWATAEAVETDLSLGSLLRGRIRPRRIILRSPRITLRLDRDGHVLDLPDVPGAGGGSRTPPEIVVENGQVTFRPPGRPAMSIAKIDARVQPGPEGASISGEAHDPTWGRWTARGSMTPDLHRGAVRLEGARFAADRETLQKIAFVPTAVWSHVVPEGPVDVAVTLGWQAGKGPTQARAEVTLRDTSARFPSLDLAAEKTTGRLAFADGVVTVDDVNGEAIGGHLAARGTLDFAGQPPRFALGLDLRGVNVADMPASWQLREAGITGRLTGNVQLRALLRPEGIDLTGSEGEAVVEGGTIEGIPVKSLRLVMRADKDDLQYQADQKAAALGPSGIERAITESLRAWAVSRLVALQPPAEAKAEKTAPAEPKKKGLLLPRTITTRIELEDVDMAQVVSRVQFMLGFPFPLPVQGKLGLKADATIPIGRLRDLKEYAIHGDVTLKDASLARLDVGRASARIDLADGRLDLKDLRGWLVDDPGGGPDNPPHPASGPDVPESGPLPPGAFRGDLRAELSPPGAFTARIEANELPVGELAGPILPRPTPLSGLASFQLDGRADLARAGDPKAWDVSGQAESRRITFRGAVLDRVALRFHLKDGKLDVPDLNALLKGQPLRSRGTFDLTPPYPFDGTLDVTRWDLNTLFTLIPSVPQPTPLAGTLDARGTGSGTLSPLAIETSGEGHLGRFQAGPLPLGDVPIRWATEGEAIAIHVDDARPLGGQLSGEGRIPIAPGKPTEGSARFEAIDTARLSAAIPDRSLTMTGKADGSLSFTIPPSTRLVEAKLQLDAPDLTIQGIPTEHLRVDLRAHRGTLKYEATADSLGGTIRFRGDSPLTAGDGSEVSSARGRLQFVGFRLDRLGKALGRPGVADQIEGLGALDANLRVPRSGRDAGLWLHGITEFRDLSWGPRAPLGRLRGIVALTPTGWRIDPITGDLLGGVTHGSIWGATPAPGREAQALAHRLGFEVRVDEVPLTRALGVFPDLATRAAVEGNGNLRMAGSLSDTFRGTGEIDMPRGRLAGLPLHELRVPVELALTPADGAGTLQVRRGSARLAGGQVRGDAWFRLGADRSFHGDLNLAALDLEAITRLWPEVSRPATGRISGRMNVEGPDPAQAERYRGKILLDLTDASLVAVPVFREIDRMLGSASGGLFEDGDLVATIANRHVIVEAFTLNGRLAQLHASGTVGFGGQLDLDVLVNTNQIISQTGEALARLIPGLSDVQSRRDGQATLRVANFLSNRLLKLHVTGTIRNPTINANPGLVVAETAVVFFAGVLKLPLGVLR